MSRKIKAAPGLAQDRTRRLVNHLIGTGGGWTVAVTVLFLVSLGWFTDSLFEWMTAADHWLVGWAIEPWMPLHRIVGVLLFPLLVLLLYRRARGARDDIQARIVVETEPYPVQGLILYLSNLRPDQIEQLAKAMREPLDLDALCKTLGSLNWYMPFRAIDFHKSRLRHVIAICSVDEQLKDGEIRYGSASQFDQFAQLLERLLPEHRFSLLNASELPDDETAKHPKGIDFEAADVVSDVTNEAFSYLRAQGLPLSEILIDITGGQKPNAVAGTAIALAEGRRIQYVSLKDYRVKVYDVTYEQ